MKNFVVFHKVKIIGENYTVNFIGEKKKTQIDGKKSHVCELEQLNS